MENVKIGGVELEVSANAAPLEKTIEKGKRSLADYSRSGNNVLEALRDRAVRTKLAVLATVTAIVGSVQNAIDTMDRLAKASVSIGMTADELSRLEYAAKLSGVQTEQLTASITSLARRAAERDEMSEGVRLFQALGVASQGAGGKVRRTDEILRDIAERFSTMEDGLGKTEIATRLFGDAGVRLIPMLNQGAKGLDDMMDEAHNLGLVLTDDAARASEHFNDTIAAVVAMLTGHFRNAVVEVLPSLQYLADKMVDTSKKTGEAERSFSLLNTTLKMLITTGVAVQATFNAIGSVVSGVVRSVMALLRGEFKGSLKELAAGVNSAIGDMIEGSKDINVIWSGWSTSSEKAVQTFRNKTAAPFIKTSAEIVLNLQAIQKANQAAFQDLMSDNIKGYGQKVSELEGMVRRGAIGFREFSEAVRTLNNEANADTLQDIVDTNTMPFEEKMQRLNDVVMTGTLGWREYAQAVKSVNKQQDDAMNDMVSATSTALTSIFRENKAAAIASALINTYQGITKALAAYPPPYSFAMAGIQAAMGFAQVAQIRATTETSSGGGGAAPAPAAAPAQAGGGGGSNQTLTVEGINPGQLLTGDMVRGLVKRILDYQRDGGKVVLV